jgi:hypothetical protein
VTFEIIVSRALPIVPSPGEVGRRIVRHGMADVLAWLGEEVGPAPDELTHSLVSLDGGAAVLFVSQELMDRLRPSIRPGEFSIVHPANPAAPTVAELEGGDPL